MESHQALISAVADVHRIRIWISLGQFQKCPVFAFYRPGLDYGIRKHVVEVVIGSIEMIVGAFAAFL